jgi:hypothetical protein
MSPSSITMCILDALWSVDDLILNRRWHRLTLSLNIWICMVQRKWYRNLLMKGFHLFVRMVAGGGIRDTQVWLTHTSPWWWILMRCILSMDCISADLCRVAEFLRTDIITDIERLSCFSWLMDSVALKCLPVLLPRNSFKTCDLQGKLPAQEFRGGDFEWTNSNQHITCCICCITREVMSKKQDGTCTLNHHP